jgi:hypothetical protein
LLLQALLPKPSSLAWHEKLGHYYLGEAGLGSGQAILVLIYYQGQQLQVHGPEYPRHPGELIDAEVGAGSEVWHRFSCESQQLAQRGLLHQPQQRLLEVLG